MEKNLYIDASHPNEIRIVVKSNNYIEDYEHESKASDLIKNNIYLGKISRIEPSLQAAFVDFGRDKHGFLPFNDIQPDYYQLPQSDIQNIKNKNDLLKNINQYFDDLILVEINLLEKSSSRDMIFEIIMLRFDILSRYRSSVLKIFKVFKSNPGDFVLLIPLFIESIEIMAKSSNINTNGIVYFENMKSITNTNGDLVVISRSSEASIRNELGQVKER